MCHIYFYRGNLMHIYIDLTFTNKINRNILLARNYLTHLPQKSKIFNSSALKSPYLSKS